VKSDQTGGGTPPPKRQRAKRMSSQPHEVQSGLEHVPAKDLVGLSEGLTEPLRQIAKNQETMRQAAAGGGLTEVVRQIAKNQEAMRQAAASRSLTDLLRQYGSFGQQAATSSAGRRRTLNQGERPPESKEAIPELKRLEAHAPPGWAKSHEAKRFSRAIQKSSPIQLLVLATDIRQSTQVMREAVDAYQFASVMGRFVQDARKVVWDAKGVFDKFTGDGFLAYWSFTAGQMRAVVKRGLGVARTLQTLFRDVTLPQFRANSRNFPGYVALAVGLDDGPANIVAMPEDPTVVGLPVVGAVRMVNAADPWETLLNVHLGELIRKGIDHGDYDDVEVLLVNRTTKEYEDQVAYRVLFRELLIPPE
jgi:class 3 adenylate cyclase